MSGRLAAWAPPLVWAALIFWASGRPAVPVALEHGTDKLAHFAAYAVLGLLLARAARLRAHPPLLPLALGLLYAASDELHQAFVPGRHADLGDWVADALGVAAGLHLYRFRRAGHTERRGARSADTTGSR